MNRFWATLHGFLVGALVGFATYWAGATIAGIPDLIAMGSRASTQAVRPLTTFTYWELVLVTAGAFVGAAVSRYRWRISGLLGFIGLASLAVGYVAYALWVSIPRVPDGLQWLSWILLGAEAGLLFLVVMAAFYSLDVATRRRWDRLPRRRPFDGALRPKVAILIPMFNEPGEMVEQTIAHAVRQDYPRDLVEVWVLDDSTDAASARHNAQVSRRMGARYIHRRDRRGFKAGAINHALWRMGDDIDVIGIIDADYWVSPDWLRTVVGHFTDPRIGFIQTPQEYRNESQSFLTRQYKRAEAYFYHAMMPSRNEENAIIFCGTMGLVRKKALVEVGGFAEDQICEDAEVSVRLIAAGWDSLYVDRPCGRGLMPATFDAYKKQFHRWAFGNVKILFTHGGSILRSRMKRRQKLDFIVSNLHWFDGLMIMIVATSLLYLGLSPVLGYEAVTYHQNEVGMLALVPTLLLVDSLLRLHLVLKQAGAARLRDAFLVQGMWFAIKVTNLAAVVKAMLGFKTPFVRTPKDTAGRRGRFRSLLRAARVTKFESLMAAALFAVAGLDAYHLRGEPVMHSILPAWLALYGLFFACAPIYAYLSYRTVRPMEFAGLALGEAAGTRRPKGSVQFVRAGRSHH